MGKHRWILWQALITPGMERFIVSGSNSGFECRFTADLAVDDDGLVAQHGVNWKAVATSGALA